MMKQLLQAFYTNVSLWADDRLDFCSALIKARSSCSGARKSKDSKIGTSRKSCWHELAQLTGGPNKPLKKIGMIWWKHEQQKIHGVKWKWNSITTGTFVVNWKIEIHTTISQWQLTSTMLIKMKLWWIQVNGGRWHIISHCCDDTRLAILIYVNLP